MSKAFTLIELLIVIAIIGILSAIILPNYMASREKARDTTRKNDLVQIQKALELYRMDQADSSFPESITFGDVWETGNTVYMKFVPEDPLHAQDDDRNYAYVRSVGGDSNSLTYTLCARLENTAEADSDKISICNEVAECSGTGGTSADKCYYLTFE